MLTDLDHTSHARTPFDSKARNTTPAMMYQKVRASAESVGKNMPVELMSIPVPAILPIREASISLKTGWRTVDHLVMNMM